MAGAVAGIRIIVVAAVVSATWLAGPATAGVGDPVDAAVGSSGGDAAPDPVRDAGDSTVGKVSGSSDDPEDTVRKATKPVQRAVRDTVRKVTESVEPAPEETSSGAQDESAEPSQGADRSPRDPEPAVGWKRRGDRAASAAQDARDSSARAASRRQRANRAEADRTRAAAETRAQHWSTRGDSIHPTVLAHRGAEPVAAAPQLPDGHPCASSSLAVRDLRLCARADTSLPGLGGLPRALLPAGLLLVGLGLVLVASGRRAASVAPAT